MQAIRYAYEIQALTIVSQAMIIYKPTTAIIMNQCVDLPNLQSWMKNRKLPKFVYFMRSLLAVSYTHLRAHETG